MRIKKDAPMRARAVKVLKVNGKVKQALALSKATTVQQVLRAMNAAASAD